jgi:hypothetical protein
MNAKMPVIRARSLSVALLAALVVGLLASWRLQFEPGTIGLFHDWSIFPAANQNIAYAQQLFDGWFRWILGEPVVLPTEYPLRFAFAALGAIGLGGDVVSHMLVFLVPAVSFLTAWLLVRDLSQSDPGALAAGLFYALNPVMLDKIVSGQASYVVSYSLLPAVLWIYERAIVSRSIWAAAGFGLTLGIAAIQMQLGVVGAFLTFLLAVIPHRESGVARRVAVWISGCLIATIIHLPTIVGVASGAAGFENLAQFSNSAAYLDLNSINILDAVRLVGYVARYAEFAVMHWWPLWNAAMIVVLICVVIGIVKASSRFRALAIVSLFFVFALVTGTKSPFGFGIVWLFDHVRYMRSIGELYHLMVVPALIYACALGFAVRFLQELRTKRMMYGIAMLSVALTCAPMMTGDASGWLHAFPLDSAYGDALRDQAQGASRVLWLPMEQPLSFRGKGAGVDPMAVTKRGSLWDYTLDWPLTAIDADIHNGGELTSALRALNVGVVVDRNDMRSELWRYVADGKDAREFLEHRLPLPLPIMRRYSESTAYAVPDPLPFTWRPKEIAILPKRLSVCAAAMLAGYAPFGFAQKRPPDLPFAMIYDPQDVPEEAVELAGAERQLETVNVYAPWGFAPIAAWWWLRNEYADAPNVELTIDPHVETIFSHPAFKNAVAVTGWIASPTGGRMQIAAAGHSFIIDTVGSGQWRSQAVPLGPLSRGAPVSVASLDRSGEVAVRGFTLVEASDYARMLGSWQRTLKAATTRIAIHEQRTESLERTGTTSALGYLDGTNFYRLIPDEKGAEFLVQTARGYPLARVTSVFPVFQGRTGKAKIHPYKFRFGWRLLRVTRHALHIPEATNDSDGRLIAWNWAPGDWRTTPAAKQFATAIGTTVFEFSRPETHPQIRYAKTREFHTAYEVGSAVLIIGLLVLIVRTIWQAGREPARRTRAVRDDVVA